MNFGEVLERIATQLRAQEVPFALVGGFGLAAFGIPRATLDLDLLVPQDAQGAVIAFMEGLGYETLYWSTGYSNHLHTDPRFGRVDFVYVRGETRDRIFAGARSTEGPGGVSVLVPRAEHLIAMKVHAMKNDSRRMHREMADIRELLRVADLDLEEVRSYFEKHGMLALWGELAADHDADAPRA